jgi:Calcineurin-like phosphoesterase
LPGVRREAPSDVEAIFCADLHLCHTAPLARAGEKDWYLAMQRVLDELRDLRNKYDYCPIVVAGDIFDRWNAQPELINFALEALPDCYAIPGNHDLPHHQFADIGKSAFYTLVKAEKIIPINPGETAGANALRFHGFPCGHEVRPFTMPVNSMVREIAVIHQYIWAEGTGHTDADQEAHTSKWAKRLKGYDVAVFGDNHQGFSKGTVWNCGSMMRRRADQKDYRPSVGLLKKDGTVIRHHLDCSKDIFTEDAVELAEQLYEGTAAFLAELGASAGHAIDFLEALTRFLDKNGIDGDLRKAVLQRCEKK